MAIPDYQTLMLPVLLLLSDNKCHTSREINEKLANDFKLSEEERKRIYGNNNPKIIFNDRINWARTYLKKAGLINYPERSMSQITKQGLKILKSNPTRIDDKFLRQFDSFNKFRNYETQNTDV